MHFSTHHIFGGTVQDKMKRNRNSRNVLVKSVQLFGPPCIININRFASTLVPRITAMALAADRVGREWQLSADICRLGAG